MLSKEFEKIADNLIKTKNLEMDDSVFKEFDEVFKKLEQNNRKIFQLNQENKEFTNQILNIFQNKMEENFKFLVVEEDVIERQDKIIKEQDEIIKEAIKKMDIECEEIENKINNLEDEINNLEDEVTDLEDEININSDEEVEKFLVEFITNGKIKI